MLDEVVNETQPRARSRLPGSWKLRGARRRLQASHGRLVSYVAGSTPGQAQPTHAPGESS